ncbi:MAG: superoxide dismutase [Bacteroidales bacterium]|nr:superoxide dismutase [Bacteroidales bacterium]
MTVKGVTSGILKKSRRRKRTEFIQPKLPYAFNALEPHIDRHTMELHYNMHHASYTQKFNEAAKELGIVEKPIRHILAGVSKYPESIRNNGGGYMNHVLFWNMMSPNGGGSPSGLLLDAINREFGSIEAFKDKFSAAAGTVFGSGWAWLIIKDQRFVITTTQNQDNPLMDIVENQGYPLLCLDVWEHAYYVKNQNRRYDYISAFWNVVNWDFVSRRYAFWQKKAANHA